MASIFIGLSVRRIECHLTAPSFGVKDRVSDFELIQDLLIGEAAKALYYYSLILTTLQRCAALAVDAGF